MVGSAIINGPVLAVLLSAGSVFGMAGAAKLAGVDQPEPPVYSSKVSTDFVCLPGKACSVVPKGMALAMEDDATPLSRCIAPAAAGIEAGRNPPSCALRSASVETIDGLSIPPKDQSRLVQRP